MKTFALLLALTVSASGMDRLDALWMIETGGNDHIVGRAGEISRYQVRPAVWQSVSKSRRFTEPETARMVAERVMEKRVQTFASTFGRQPTDFEYYGLWNAPNQVMGGKVSHVVAERCRRFSNLCSSGEMALARR